LISYNKVFAKLGSDMKKPDAITELPESRMAELVWPLPCADLFYCGRATEKKLALYIPNKNSVVSLVLGQYDGKELMYCGHVTLGVSRKDFETISCSKTRRSPSFKEVPKGNENAVWLTPTLVCVVKYMTRSESGMMRQPVYKGLRYDKAPKECLLNLN